MASLAAAGLEARAAGGWVDIGPGSSRNPLEVDLLYAPVFKRAEPVPLGTGPFTFVEGDARHIVLQRVKPVPGRVARVEFHAVPTARDAFALALRGEANAVLN
ncbi:MAG TPA: ABC transporter substrate-binding protein, partial [Anaeromyxobacteraceae bacterium]|nr:ABC transporter substrate-binding protein [Anaeromyxobacteraceae bacterium]